MLSKILSRYLNNGYISIYIDLFIFLEKVLAKYVPISLITVVITLASGIIGEFLNISFSFLFSDFSTVNVYGNWNERLHFL